MQPVSPILLVTRGLDPVGTGRQVELAAAGLAAAGYEVAVAVTSTGGSLADRLLAGGAGLHVVGRRPGVDAAATARLAGLEITPVSDVAEAAWAAVHGQKMHTLVGKTAKKLAFAARWMPGALRA